MSKVFKRFGVFIVVFFGFLYQVQAQEISGVDDIKIISRSEWGADESLRYQDTKIWQDYFNSISNKPETSAQKKENEKRKSIDNYLTMNFPESYQASEVIRNENGHKLVWPITKTKYVKGIIVHHTATEAVDSYEAMRSIYKSHAVTRRWGDIGYNYVIGLNGEIFEGRAGGDYAVGAHALRNNYSTVGISIIGNYQDKAINQEQYNSLKKLIIYLGTKYGIDLNGKHTYHKDCKTKECSFYLSSFESDTIIGHKDAGNTSCPGNTFYSQLQWLKNEVRNGNISTVKPKENILNSASNQPESEEKSQLDYKLDAMNEYDLLKILAVLDYRIDNSRGLDTNLLNQLKLKILLSIKKKQDNKKSLYSQNTNFDKTNYIKIKLSYPHNDSISINKGGKIYDIKVSNGKLLLANGQLTDNINITGEDLEYLEISSWKRKPEWDKENRYNDNKFKGNINLYVKDNKLLVINEVLFSDYLKGLGEVSDGDNQEKIKTIIIAARTYARWYTTEARKFPGEYYDGSDNPDEFQKYLGYGLQVRSPRINKIVDETENKIITYNGKIIKPWYFSQSNGQTMSYVDYCKQNSTKCSDGDYPFLAGVFDPGSVGKNKLGHGVGISGAGATYLALKGWNSEMIIKYYLNGVNLEKM